MKERRQATPIIKTDRPDFIRRYRQSSNAENILDEERQRNDKRYEEWMGKLRSMEAPEELEDIERISESKVIVTLCALSIAIWAVVMIVGLWILF